MTMRVPNLMNNAQSLLDLQRIKQQYSETVLQLTTGEANVNIGDNPAANAEVMNYQATINLNTQYIAQGATAATQLRAPPPSSAPWTTDITQRAGPGQERAGQQHRPPPPRPRIGTQVDAMRTDLISLGNTQEHGTYLFAGTDTTTVPFTQRHIDDAQQRHLQRQQRDHQPERGRQRHHRHQHPRQFPVLRSRRAGIGHRSDGPGHGRAGRLEQRQHGRHPDRLPTTSRPSASGSNSVRGRLGGRENSVTALQNGLNDLQPEPDQAQQSTLDVGGLPHRHHPAQPGERGRAGHPQRHGQGQPQEPVRLHRLRLELLQGQGAQRQPPGAPGPLCQQGPCRGDERLARRRRADRVGRVQRGPGLGPRSALQRAPGRSRARLRPGFDAARADTRANHGAHPGGPRAGNQVGATGHAAGAGRYHHHARWGFGSFLPARAGGPRGSRTAYRRPRAAVSRRNESRGDHPANRPALRTHRNGEKQLVG